MSLRTRMNASSFWNYTANIILSKDPNYCHLSQRCLKTKSSPGNIIKVHSIHPSILVTYWILLNHISNHHHGSKKSNINPSPSHGSPHFILLLQEVTWQCRSFLPAGWLKGPWGSRQQLNNLYWVTYKSFICCDQVQLEFEPWMEDDSNGKYIFSI